MSQLTDQVALVEAKVCQLELRLMEVRAERDAARQHADRLAVANSQLTEDVKKYQEDVAGWKASSKVNEDERSRLYKRISQLEDQAKDALSSEDLVLQHELKAQLSQKDEQIKLLRGRMDRITDALVWPLPPRNRLKEDGDIQRRSEDS